MGWVGLGWPHPEETKHHVYSSSLTTRLGRVRHLRTDFYYYSSIAAADGRTDGLLPFPVAFAHARGRLLACLVARSQRSLSPRRFEKGPPAARTQTVPALLLQRSSILSCSHAWRILKGPKKYSMLILPTPPRLTRMRVLTVDEQTNTAGLTWTVGGVTMHCILHKVRSTQPVTR